jgi:hypothetical protein
VSGLVGFSSAHCPYSDMSSPNFLVWPVADAITSARISSTARLASPEVSPTIERIWKWQAGTRNGKNLICTDHDSLTCTVAVLVEKSSPDDTPRSIAGLPRSVSAPTPTIRTKAWRKLVETLRPNERKKRRAKEFDAMMRHEFDNPIGETAEEDWRTVRSEGERSDYAAMMRGDDIRESVAGNWTSVLARVARSEASVSAEDDDSDCDAIDEASDNMSLFSALAYTRPEEVEEEKEEITALPPYPAHLQNLALSKKEKKLLKKAKSMML